MISHVIGTLSDKSVFGQCGPENINDLYFLQQTICRKFLKDIKIQMILYIIQNTMKISNNYYSFLVKIFVCFNNPQITNSRINILSKFKITYFFKLSMIVGISEAIRLLLTFSLYKINIKILYLIVELKSNFSFLLQKVFSFTEIKQLSMISFIPCLNTQNGDNNNKSSDPFNE